MVDYESDLIRFIVHDFSILDLINIKGEYFSNKLNGKFFDFLKKNRSLDYIEMLKAFSTDETNMLVNIVYNSDYAESGKGFANSYALMIIENYKKRQTNYLTDIYKNEIIEFDEYYSSLTEINNLTIEPKIEYLTEEKVKDIITEENKFIKIKRFEYLSYSLRIEKTDLITVAATSGFGKSAFLLNIYQSLSQDNSENYKCHYFNLEVSPKIMVKRLLAITSNHDINEFNKSNIDKEFVKESVQKIINNSYIKSGSITLESLKEKVLNNLDTNKINVIFVDHIGLLDTNEKAYNKSEYDKTTYCMKELRKFALDYNLIIFIASQFDRDSVKNKKISMHSLKSSGEIENSSTHVLLLKESEQRTSNNKKQYEEVLIDVAKNRNNSIELLDFYTFIKPKQIFNEAYRDAKFQL